MDERSRAAETAGKSESVVYDTRPGGLRVGSVSLDALSTRVELASVCQRAGTPRGMGSPSFPRRRHASRVAPARR
jgi:hypothetical protein